MQFQTERMKNSNYFQCRCCYCCCCLWLYIHICVLLLLLLLSLQCAEITFCCKRVHECEQHRGKDEKKREEGERDGKKKQMSAYIIYMMLF